MAKAPETGDAAKFRPRALSVQFKRPVLWGGQHREKIPKLLPPICAQLHANDPSIVSLNLASKELGPASARLLAEALRSNTHLVYLTLLGNKIGDEGAAVLADALAGNRSLRSLDLVYNNIGDIGAVELKFLLAKNNTLIDLKLKYNDISPVILQALQSAIADNLEQHNLIEEQKIEELPLGTVVGEIGSLSIASSPASPEPHTLKPDHFPAASGVIAAKEEAVGAGAGGGGGAGPAGGGLSSWWRRRAKSVTEIERAGGADGAGGADAHNRADHASPAALPPTAARVARLPMMEPPDFLPLPLSSDIPAHIFKGPSERDVHSPPPKSPRSGTQSERQDGSAHGRPGGLGRAQVGAIGAVGAVGSHGAKSPPARRANEQGKNNLSPPTLGGGGGGRGGRSPSASRDSAQEDDDACVICLRPLPADSDAFAVYLNCCDISLCQDCGGLVATLGKCIRCGGAYSAASGLP